MKKRPWIIDTNVICVVNGEATQVTSTDLAICEDFIIDVFENGITFVDSLSLILEEYFGHANYSGKPNLGDKFAKWVHDNQFNENFCRRIRITPTNDSNDDFAEFDTSGSLSNFDRADRKFVAVSLSCRNEPAICNATDSDWFEHQDALSEIGVRIHFLCRDQLQKWQEAT